LSKKLKKKASKRDAQGRTHLVVHRDAQGRVQRLTLAQPLFNDAWQNDIAVAAASTAHGIMSQGRTPENAVELGRNAMEGTSKIAAGLLARSSQAPACRNGCAHCCYQSVGVSAPEVLAIYDHLVSTRSPAELTATVERIRAADDATRGMSSADRFSPELPCPFLENERCSIYEARPLACRGKNSLDAEACEQTLRDPTARAKLLDGTLKVPCFLEPIRAFHAIAGGVQLALAELHGLQVAPLELSAAMRILVDDPEGVPCAWLAGRDPFAAARGGDSTDDPRSRELAGAKRS
jgi:Fe-S-cluster containining protein